MVVPKPRYLAGRCAVNTTFDISITAARVQAAGNYRDGTGTDSAVQNLDRVIAEARRSNFTGVVMEARLARGEIQIRSGRSAAGRAELEPLAEEAQAKGYGLVARRAARLIDTRAIVSQ